MKHRYLLLLAFLLSVSLHHTNAWSEKNKDKDKKDKKETTQLVMTAVPRQGFRPLHVTFNVVLKDVADNDEKFYCLQEEWDFGDGAVSSETPNCDPYTPETKINKQFFAEHIFDDASSYTVRFSLGEDRKYKSNQLVVVVLENDIPH
jgi:hypothetical protein